METVKFLIERNRVNNESGGTAHDGSCYAFLTAAHECMNLAMAFSDEGNEGVISEIVDRLELILIDIQRESHL